MYRKTFLDSIDVPSPCSEGWDSMVGDDKKRHCLGCNKDVFNLSTMTRSEARKLMVSSRGEICVRYARMPNGRIVTTEQSRLHQITRSSAVAAGVIAASLSLSAITYAQGEPILTKADRETVNKGIAKNGSQFSHISFTVHDPQGSVIAQAKVTLTNTATKQEFTASANEAGVAAFEDLPHGNYEMNVTSSGFRPYENSVVIQQVVEPNIEVNLAIATFVGTVVDVWSDIPLFQAIAQKDNETVIRAVNGGFNINQTDRRGMTALHIAVEHGNLEIVRFLLDHKAKINAKDNEKLTPIWMLGEVEDEKTCIEILQLLISHGADVNVPNDEGETLLMKACEDDNLEGVRIFLKAGADVNLKDDDDETALDKTSSDEIKRLLITNGARPK